MAFCVGTMIVWWLVLAPHSAKFSTPLTGCSSPFNPSSPIARTSSVRCCGNCLLATKIDRAMARSRCDPSLAILAGVKLMVIRFAGKVNPELTMADRTRSRDSAMALLASPTILNDGKPLVMSHSAVTKTPSKPLTTAVSTRAIIVDSIA